MVKGSIKIAPVAHYEADQRTVRVSMKPAVGKQIISDDMIQAAQGSFSSHFEAERFIFGKIREYTLRTAAHGNIVSVAAVRSESHSNEDIHESLHYRVAAKAVLDRCSVSSKDAPKHLLGHVAGLMIRDAHVSVSRTEDIHTETQKSVRVLDGSRFSPALRSCAGAQGLHLDHKTVRSILNSIAAVSIASSSIDQYSNGQRKGTDSSATERMQASLLFMLAILSSRVLRTTHKTSTSSQSNHFKFHELPELSTKVHAASASVSKDAAGPWLGLKKEAGFGTAPIWYQQSMPNGPPPQTSRWNKAMSTMTADILTNATASLSS